MTRVVRILAVAAAVVVAIGGRVPVAANAQTLAQRLDRRLDGPGLEHLLWGVAVTDLDGNLLYGRNADRLFIPASNTKLVVSVVTNALLGPDFTTKTSVYATGPVVDGVVEGDLVLYGRGDPTFSQHCYDADTTRPGVCDRNASDKLHQLAAQLAQLGIRRVAGELVGDGSYFESELVHPAWENYDLGWWYAAPVSGLGFNDNSVDFHEVAANEAGMPPSLEMTPALGIFSLDNRAVTGPRGSRNTFDIFRLAGDAGYQATGSLPLGTHRVESAAVRDPNRYAALAFRHELVAQGITVDGATRSTVDSFSYQSARWRPPLAEVRSRPLRDWLYPILSSSQNWFAEMTLKQLGRQRGGGGSWAHGIEVERRFLIDSVGIDSTAFSLQDGSGLAANNLVTPRAFTRLLAWARRHPNFESINRALPESGKPGTLLNRFRGTVAASEVRAKTGSISGVNTLSGYLQRADGKVLVFSILANHHNIGSARMIAAIDSVVVELGRR